MHYQVTKPMAPPPPPPEECEHFLRPFRQSYPNPVTPNADRRLGVLAAARLGVYLKIPDMATHRHWRFISGFPSTATPAMITLDFFLSYKTLKSFIFYFFFGFFDQNGLRLSSRLALASALIGTKFPLVLRFLWICKYGTEFVNNNRILDFAGRMPAIWGDDTSSSWWCFPSEILHRYTLNRELGKVQNLAEIGGAKQRGDRSWREYSCSRIRAAPAINSFQGKITQRIVYRSKFQGIDGFHRLVESRCFKF